MSMRGEIISKEYNQMVFVHDNKRKEFACYARDVQGHQEGQALSKEQQRQCLDVSQVLGDSW